MHGMVGVMRAVFCKHDPRQVSSPRTTIQAFGIVFPATELISHAPALPALPHLSSGGEGYCGLRRGWHLAFGSLNHSHTSMNDHSKPSLLLSKCFLSVSASAGSKQCLKLIHMNDNHSYSCAWIPQWMRHCDTEPFVVCSAWLTGLKIGNIPKPVMLWKLTKEIPRVSSTDMSLLILRDLSAIINDQTFLKGA